MQLLLLAFAPYLVVLTAARAVVMPWWAWMLVRVVTSVGIVLLATNWTDVYYAIPIAGVCLFLEHLDGAAQAYIDWVQTSRRR